MQTATPRCHHRVFFSFVFAVAFLLLGGLTPNLALAQTTSAGVYGRVTDKTNAAIVDAAIELKNVDTGVAQATKTNGAGIYVLPTVPPGRYVMTVVKAGFRTVSVTGITLNLQDNLSRNFELQVGSPSESITVTADGININTTDGSVSTVVDRNFAENLPLNGRSFQSLIYLTPGVVVTATNTYDGGQFSVNGQRADSNYWTVDGVSANIGVGVANGNPTPGPGLSGAVGAFSALGGTNSLVSVDALQEFRIQTSTYAPEFGRTPGGQISILTRSGTNRFHGTAFDYLRNDVFDASNWFNGYLNSPALPKAEERQNDFGGTIGGPLIKDKTFFFFSYEGLRLRLPQTDLTVVPDASFTPGGTTNSRQIALPALQPYLNAYPLPSMNSPEIYVACDPAADPTCPSSGQKASGTADLNRTFSNPATLDAYSLRIDHKLNEKLTLFGRYNYSPSNTIERAQGDPLTNTVSTSITTQTLTFGSTLNPSQALVNDFRINYSRNDAISTNALDNYGGGIPLSSLPFPKPYVSQNGLFTFCVDTLTGCLNVGFDGRNIQRQINVVDGLSWQRGSHMLKFGVDFRRLAPVNEPQNYTQGVGAHDMASAEMGIIYDDLVGTSLNIYPLFRNLGVFAQDTWKASPKLTLTYGVRWDVDFSPATTQGPRYPAAINFDNLAAMALAPTGTPPFQTTYSNFAPRLGVAYQVWPKHDWQTVLRAGVGNFYNMATQEMGNADLGSYPFGSASFHFGDESFPLSPSVATPPPITPANLGPAQGGTLTVPNPHLQLPYTLQWDVALEQGLGKQQTVSLTYLGAAGRRLVQTAWDSLTSNPNLGNVYLITNGGTSDYDALQAQFQRKLSNGLQALASYTWSHSIDTASAGFLTGENALLPKSASSNRGPSDFDFRNAFSAAVTYEIPAVGRNRVTKWASSGWSVDNVFLARSASPVDVTDLAFYGFTHGINGEVRPDVVPGQPFYLYGTQYPGGKALNPAAFADPPFDPNTGIVSRQGDLGRNALRGFGAYQWDIAIHREFPLTESIKLQFRAEMFNVVNHPNFGPPDGAFYAGSTHFGISQQMLGQYLNGGQTADGGFSSLYQIGGPRSIQLALKLFF